MHHWKYTIQEVYLKHLNFNQTTFDKENLLYDCTEIPANTRDTAVKVCGCVAVSKYGYRTRNRDTRFGNTAGFPIPVLNPNLEAVSVGMLGGGDWDLCDLPFSHDGSKKVP